MSNNLQQLVQESIDELVGSGAETGLQVAVYQHCELIVDAVAGLADQETGRAVASDTPFYSASTGKGATAAVAHVLVERGALSYDAPIVDLWPEFGAGGAHGKEKATLRHVLTHSVGLPAIPPEATIEDLMNWTTMTDALAGAELWWEPGTKMTYHAQSWASWSASWYAGLRASRSRRCSARRSPSLSALRMSCTSASRSTTCTGSQSCTTRPETRRHCR